MSFTRDRRECEIETRHGEVRLYEDDLLMAVWYLPTGSGGASG
jgi:hypothetical protein